MSQKEAKVNSHLHSIPILLKGYSIPLVCMAALLLIGGSLFIVDFGDDNLVFAEEGNEFSGEIVPGDVVPEDANIVEDVNSVIMPLAATASLTLANPTASTSLSTTVEPGGVGYVSSDVTYSASNIGDYAIRISLAEGKSNPKNGSTTLGGADNKTPANMANNTWGYAWSTNTSADQTTQAYNTVPVFGSPADVVAKTNVTDSINATGKIMFAAKFAEDATAGHYRTSVLLSMVATPKTTYTLTYDANGGSNAPTSQTCATTGSSCRIIITSDKPTRLGYTFDGWNVTVGSEGESGELMSGDYIDMMANQTLYAAWIKNFRGITNMQQMTTTTCNAANVGDETILKDTRDSSTYTVKKLQDGKCWMTQNLRIVNKSISDADSDLQNATTKTYTIPASSTSGFSSDTASNAYYGNNTTYGAYYTWCAATAGTCTSATTNLAEASGSICPKGWRLPKSGTGTGTNDFANMAGIPTTTSITTSNMWSSVPTKSFASSTLTLRDSAWPAAGRYNSGSPNYIGSFGFYWSSTANDSTLAYSLRFGSSNFDPANLDGRYGGYSVRCVAE